MEADIQSLRGQTPAASVFVVVPHKTGGSRGLENHDRVALRSPQEILNEIHSAYCDPDSWNFVTNGLHNGDTYIVMSLMRYFVAQGRKVRFFADTTGKYDILRLFEDLTDGVQYCPELASVTTQDVTDWGGTISPGSLVSLHPLDARSSRLPIDALVYSKGHFNLAEAFKATLRLPLRLAPSPPAPNAAIREKGESLFDSYGLERGQTIVVFPHAQTLKYETYEIMNLFADRAQAAGFKVCSAVHGKEAPLPGTQPIQLGFDTLSRFCELAGHVVSLRSGIGDMLSAVEARKVYLYPSSAFACFETPNDYGLFDGSASVVVEPGKDLATASKMLAALGRPSYASVENFVPYAVRQYLATSGGWARDVSFGADSGAKFGRFALFRGAVLAEGWNDLEIWGVWSLGFRAVVYFRPPPRLAGPDEEAFLELTLSFPAGPDEPPFTFDIQFNGRRLNTLTAGSFNVVRILLTEPDREIGVHRVIFDVANPRQPGGRDERRLGVGLRRAQYVKNRRAGKP